MGSLYRFDTPAFEMMAKAFSQLFYAFNVNDRDVLLPRMAEICTYMVIELSNKSLPSLCSTLYTLLFSGFSPSYPFYASYHLF